ncbi:YrhB domain-containing protein [Micromonospora orduensis]|uniref:YrhB domain-containing protein n=1 Tax=Micromonospora orduensis TaxID=1420891 RepID=UPI0038197F1C
MATSMDSARRIAEGFLDEEVRGRFNFPIVIVESAVREVGDFWVFPYNGKAYVELGDWQQAMAGNVPVVVNKITGDVGFRSN